MTKKKYDKNILRPEKELRKVNIGVRIKESEAAILQERAYEEGMSVSAFVRKKIARYMK